MTFSILLVKDDQPRVVGTLWATDQANAEALAPAICGCSNGESIRVRRTEDRDIPFKLSSAEPPHFC